VPHAAGEVIDLIAETILQVGKDAAFGDQSGQDTVVHVQIFPVGDSEDNKVILVVKSLCAQGEAIFMHGFCRVGVRIMNFDSMTTLDQACNQIRNFAVAQVRDIFLESQPEDKDTPWPIVPRCVEPVGDPFGHTVID
jgi:hypothetical protein